MITFTRIPQPCSLPGSDRWKYTFNGQVIGYHSTAELQIMRDAAQSDLKKIEGWMDEKVVQDVRDLLAAIDKALEEVAA